MNPARVSALVRPLFDPGVASAELRDDADPALLYPAEAAACVNFAPRRLADFTAGRLCARRALAEFGITNYPILVNADRSPRWPPGIVGSISHTTGYRCAVVAPAQRCAGIGIDAELAGGVSTEIEALVCTTSERATFALLTSAERRRAATIVFSAKEAFFKCQYPRTRRWFDFRDVAVDVVPADDGAADSGTFTVRALTLPTVVPSAQGRYCIDGGIVITGVALSL